MSSSTQVNNNPGSVLSGSMLGMSSNYQSLPFDTKAFQFVPSKFREAQKSTFLKSVI